MTMNFEWSSYDSLSLFAEFRTLHQFTVAGFVHEPNVLDAWLIVSPEFGALFLLKKKLTKKTARSQKNGQDANLEALEIIKLGGSAR